MQDTVIAMEITKGQDKIVFDGGREINIRFLTKRGPDMMDVKSKKLTPDILFGVMYPKPWPHGWRDLLLLVGAILFVIGVIFGIVIFFIVFAKDSNGGELNAVNLLIHGPQPRGLLGGFM